MAPPKSAGGGDKGKSIAVATSTRQTRSQTQARTDGNSPVSKLMNFESPEKRKRMTKAKEGGSATKKIKKEKEEAAVEEDDEADEEAEASVKKTIVIEHCKQDKSFKERANEVKEGLEKAAPGIIVTLNPDKPRRGYFEIREEGGETFISLLVKLKMGLDYSYTQPSESEDYYGGNSVDSVYMETEDLIRWDQAEIRYNARARVEYPPQPEVEFGFPQICYCGAPPLLATSTSRNDPGRRYYTCAHVDDGERHVSKWWDVAVMEEMRARDRHVLQMAEKVDSLTLLPDYETEQKIARLEKIVREKPRFSNGFEYFVGLTGIVLVVIAFVCMFK